MALCRNCRKQLKGQTFTSPTGGTVCRSCHDVIMGGALAGMTGGGLGAAVAQAGNDRDKGGILHWVRTALRGKRARSRDGSVAEVRTEESGGTT